MSGTSVTTGGASFPANLVDPVGTVRRHFDMLAVKHSRYEWLIIYPDPDEPPVLTEQRIEDIAEKWPLVRRPGPQS